MKFKRNILFFIIYIVGIFSTNVYSAYSSNKLSYNYGFAKYGQLKYSKDFTNFAYVNPNAPKQGNLTLSIGSNLFDKFNPYTLKGEAAPAINMLMFDTLGVTSMDEEASIYGLIADGIKVTNQSITFHINPAAKFNNGDKITANDVKFSFETLMKEGSPTFSFLYADIDKANVENEQVISFMLKKNNSEMPLLISSLPIFSKKWLKKKKFSQLSLEPPISSSIYLIDKYYQGRSIKYKLNPNYWAKNHPTRKGMFNFSTITFEIYQDDVARLEAFKAGNFDAITEYRAKNWATAYKGKMFDNKQILKQEFKHNNGNGMQGFAFNTRKPIFADIRVRQALSLALDFEWLNKQLFYNSYTRLNSYFSNTDFASQKQLLTLEKQYLMQANLNFNPQNMQNIFTNSALISNTTSPNSLRNNLILAQKLLASAGWIYKDGALRNTKNEAFTFELLDANGGLSRVISAYVRNLEKLGINVSQRVIDPAIYQKRLEQFDFDMTSVRFPDNNLPGNELVERFSSKSANTFGSDNIMGVKNKQIDYILSLITSSNDKPQLSASVRALDRLLLNNYYIIPHWYTNTHRIAYQNFLAYPAVLPKFYGAESWIISTWWSMKK